MPNNLYKDIEKLYEKFYETTDIRYKAFIWNVFSNLYNIYPKDRNVRNMFKNISINCNDVKRFINESDNCQKNEEITFLRENYSLFEQILNYDVYEFYNENESQKLDYYILKGIVSSFLKNTSKDLYEFYKKLSIEEKIILLNKHKSDGYTSILDNNGNSYITINRLNTLKDAKILIHEIGHAYYYFLNNIDLEESNVSLLIKNEIPAKWLEYLFVIYLGNYNYKIIRKKEINSFPLASYILSLYVINRLRINDENKKIEEVFNEIYENDIDSLINNNTGIKLIK